MYNWDRFSEARDQETDDEIINTINESSYPNNSTNSSNPTTPFSSLRTNSTSSNSPHRQIKIQPPLNKAAINKIIPHRKLLPKPCSNPWTQQILHISPKTIPTPAASPFNLKDWRTIIVYHIQGTRQSDGLSEPESRENGREPYCSNTDSEEIGCGRERMPGRGWDY